MAFALLAAMVLTCTGAAVADTTEMWSQQHDGGGDYIDSGTLVTQAPDGHLVVAGESSEVTGGADLYVRKLDKSTGNQIWDFRFDGVDDKDVAVTDVAWDSFGQLLLSGFIKSCVG
jgi:outer membrane protein assembly factor BamB